MQKQPRFARQLPSLRAATPTSLPTSRPAVSLLASALVASLVGGCAGAFGGYGPGMTNESRTSRGVSPDAPGWSTGTAFVRSYDSGETVYGIQLGARLGVAKASAGDLLSGSGLAVDAHTDIVVAKDRWGVGVTGGYTSDRLDAEAASYGYSGFPIAAYGQWALLRRVFLHGGVGRVLYGAVKRIEPMETSVDASAWRGFGGITYVFARSATRDLSLRIEARVQSSADVAIDGTNATWSSAGVLAELIWASY